MFGGGDHGREGTFVEGVKEATATGAGGCAAAAAAAVAV
eukprot:CAMPEP_0119403850 /NCGR_PEP_ID=MMETSP1334-20130426/143594_1 /TAXON_ID=127549 /ORGANISM="Calcidiscus leptoporus, Strain RCC1130" /LENGTH=38 /DNA_ID= /DNA_START= /DNA_END= /DNA_ORIENTATION=